MRQRRRIAEETKNAAAVRRMWSEISAQGGGRSRLWRRARVVLTLVILWHESKQRHSVSEAQEAAVTQQTEIDSDDDVDAEDTGDGAPRGGVHELLSVLRSEMSVDERVHAVGTFAPAMSLWDTKVVAHISR
jgi:hypothetical protein